MMAVCGSVYEPDTIKMAVYAFFQRLSRGPSGRRPSCPRRRFLAGWVPQRGFALSDATRRYGLILVRFRWVWRVVSDARLEAGGVGPDCRNVCLRSVEHTMYGSGSQEHKISERTA
jgi:hypothetical protein